jgi:sterol desaturase/sphingolipid hydroxylase (fatty acid hydroxylase superfamily)
MAIKSLLIFLTLSVIFTVEGVFPHYKNRSRRIQHALPHVFTALFNGILTRLVLAGLTLRAIDWGTLHQLGLSQTLQIPSYLKTAVVFVLFDIWMYFWHMANHRVGFFWLFHRAHHADTDMDTTTALRFHPGELVLSTFIRMPVIILTGMSFAEVVLFETVLNISTLFHHSNVAVPERWDRALRAVIVTPNMHRVHHSIERFETNSNYTSLLSVWDRLFRSFRKREDTRTITIGLPRLREEKWQKLPGFLITPFVGSQR